MHPEVPISFSLSIGPDYSNIAVRGLPLASPLHNEQLPSQPAEPVSIYTPGSRAEEQVRVKCLAKGHNKQAHKGFKLTTLGS